MLFMRNNNDSSSRKTLNFSIEGDILKNLDTEVQVPTQIRKKLSEHKWLSREDRKIYS